MEDAGFKDIVIVLFGEDKVFVHSSTGADVSVIVKEAKQFFDLLFSHMERWDKAVVPFQRGAWLRVYGISLHAWNKNFFKLCVLESVRYLRTGSWSLDRVRFDFVRVLIATTSLDLVNTTEQILLDGVLCDIKIIE